LVLVAELLAATSFSMLVVCFVLSRGSGARWAILLAGAVVLGVCVAELPDLASLAGVLAWPGPRGGYVPPH
jgi:hypothetical protein